MILPRSTQMAERALDGIIVVSLEQAIAAPFASRQLADHGARVIKIERPDGGDFARSYDKRARGQSSHFVWANRSKESVCLDLKSECGKNALHDLIARCDVFIQNLRPGVCESLGFGQERIRQINSNCITCSISGYGKGGPLEQRKAYDLLIQGESGFLSVTGTEVSVCKAGVSIADIAAGMYAYTNILTALISRQKGGRASHIEVSLLDAMTEWMGYPLYYCLDGQPPPKRTGASHGAIFPYGPYETKGGETFLIAIQHDREWQAFCRQVLNRPGLAEHASYATPVKRLAAMQTLQPIIARAFFKVSADNLVERLEKANVAFAQVKNVPEVWTHPQLLARSRFVEVDTPNGRIPALLPPGATLGSVRMDSVPGLGEHTDKVLAWLRESSDV